MEGPEGKPDYIGEPSDCPQDLIDDLAREAANHKSIKYMPLCQWTMDGETSYLVLIEGRTNAEVLQVLDAVDKARPEGRSP